jgi:hypothetical protein
VFEREDYTDYQDVQPRHWYMTVSVYVSYGIEDFSPALQGFASIKKNGYRYSRAPR